MTVRAPWYYVALVPKGRNAEPVDLTDRVLSFKYEDNERKTDKLALTVNNFDLSNFDDPVWRHGALLRVAFGSGAASSPVREVVVRKVTGGRVLQVEANDRAVELDGAKRPRVFENMTRSDVVRQLAAEGGFDDPDVEDTTEVFDVISQANMTDAQLMRKLAHLEGFQLFVDFDGLHWHRRRVGQAPAWSLTYYAADPKAAGDILDFSIENDITRKPGRVRVASRDPIEQVDIDVEASNETDAGRETLQEYIGVFDPETGALTQQERVAVETTIVSNAQTVEDAQAEATGKFRLATQRAVKMTVKLRGAPNLLAKSVVNISGLGARVSGKYYVKSVSHEMSRGGGYTTSAKLITDGYQRGYGGGAGGGDVDSDELVQSCLANLRAARQSLSTTQPLDSLGPLGAAVTTGGLAQAAQQLDNLIAAVEGLAGTSGTTRSVLARTAAAGAARLAQFTGQGLEVGRAAAACSAALRRVSEMEDAKSAGSVNDKAAVDQDAREAIVDVDPETGELVTRYVDKRGRA